MSHQENKTRWMFKELALTYLTLAAWLFAIGYALSFLKK